jgi:hypothetical protein
VENIKFLPLRVPRNHLQNHHDLDSKGKLFRWAVIAVIMEDPGLIATQPYMSVLPTFSYFVQIKK